MHLLLLFSGSILGLCLPSCSSTSSSCLASHGTILTLHQGSPCSGHCALAFTLSWRCLKHVLGLQQWPLIHAPGWPEFTLSCHLLQQCIDFMLGHVLRPGGCQCLGLCSGGSSASSAGSTPVVSLARAGAVPTTSNTPHHSCALTFKNSTSPVSRAQLAPSRVSAKSRTSPSKPALKPSYSHVVKQGLKTPTRDPGNTHVMKSHAPPV